MMVKSVLAALAALALSPLASVASSQAYTWKNVKIGGGGGFVPNIVFNPGEKGVAYARTDIGGVYKLNADDSWTPLLDFADYARWNYWGIDALAVDPIQTSRLYLATGMYTNSWDPNNGQILISTDYGSTWAVSKLPFKVGGNMPGRGMGERLVVDPNSNNILFFGARSGHGLWKSTDFGVTWTHITTLPNTGTYVPDPTDTSGYNSDPIGVSFVTFDSTSSTAGKATPRIFVGVASVGTANLFVSNDGGSTFSALTGTNSSWMAHKGVLSPQEHVLYISTADGAGPYDGTLGGVYKYNITSGVMSDITPVSGGDLYFGFGGLTVDLQKPGTLMVATLNSWWPDADIFRSLDGGTTWSRLWDWQSYPTMNRYYKYDDTLAPWLGPDSTTTGLTTQIGWMIEGLSIDPFDSNHWLYGTGETIYGGHDLLKWDTVHNVTLKSLADGIEEESVQGLISPPTGAHLLSAVGDDLGFVHNNLDVAPATEFTAPVWATAADIDFAGQAPLSIVRIGTDSAGTIKQVALSTDGGNTWNEDYGAADTTNGGKVALSAIGDTVLWSSGSNGVLISQYTNPFSAVPTLPSGSVIASDKVNNTIFYGASGSKFYLSTDGGKTFTATAGSIGASTAPAKVVVSLTVSGDVWVSTDVGIFHSTNFGSTFTAVPGVTQAWAIALGAAKTTGGYPAVFANAVVGGVTGFFRSDDTGASWTQINDATHGFGATGSPLAADPRIYGRVYVGTNGRGIFYGDVAGSVVGGSSTSSSASSTVKSSSTSTSSSTSKSSTTVISTSSTTSKSSTTTSKSSTTTSKSSSTASSTSKSSSSPTKSSSSPSSTSTAVSGSWGQCGGTGWTGPTACVAGTTCVAQNQYYSQCLPN